MSMSRQWAGYPLSGSRFNVFSGLLVRSVSGGIQALVIVCCSLLLGVGLSRAQEPEDAAEAPVEAPVEKSAVALERLRIGNVVVAPRDEATATVTFDITWTNSWRYGNFHDAAWVFFKVRADEKADWQPLMLAADKVRNPTGYGPGEGTPLEFVVPGGDDPAAGGAAGSVGMIVRRAADGYGLVDAKKVTAVWDLKSAADVKDIGKAQVRAYGVEMVLVPEGPFYVGRGDGDAEAWAGKGYGGMELNWLYKHNGRIQDTAEPLPFKFNIMDLYTWGVGTTRGRTPAYRIENAGPIPTGRKKDCLWAVDITPEDGGEIPADFPNGYSSFYCMKHISPTAAQYAGLLNTLTEAQAKPRYYANGHGRAIQRSGVSPNYTYSAKDPDRPCPWLSFTDGAVWAAWAGLRPTTELEYEKMCRGPRAAIPNDTTPSYWGILDTMTLGSYERPVSIGSSVGRAFKGTHGRGTAELPTDWPPDIRGAILRNDYLFGGGHQPAHLLAGGRAPVVYASADRVGINMAPGQRTYAGWRAAVSVPAGDTGIGPVTGALNLDTVNPARLKDFSADGVLAEWAGVEPAANLDSAAYIYPVHFRFPSQHCADPWAGVRDVSARCWLGWDGEALCVAAEVSDDKHVNAQTGDKVWDGDAMQLGLVNMAGERWNIGAALTGEGVVFHKWDGKDDKLLKSAGYAVVRDDSAGVTRYELRVPLADIGVKPGDLCSYYFLFFDDDDGQGCHHRIQYIPDQTKIFKRRLYPQFVIKEQP